MKKLIVLLATLVALPTASYAMSVGPCRIDGTSLLGSLGALPEDARTFANGNVRVNVAYLQEPAAADAHILIRFVTTNGTRICRAVSAESFGHDSVPLGFGGVESLYQIDSSYDASKGLLLGIAVYNNIDGDMKPAGTAQIRINQLTGTVSLE